MASSVIGALRVNLGLDSAQFDKGAKRAGSSLTSMRKQFLAVAGGAAALGGALSAMALKGAGQIDAAAKSARRLGTTIGSFRALELAAGEAGVSLSTLTDGVQTMDREIAKGSKGAARALDTLGLSAQDLGGLEADEKVALIADRIKDLGLSTGQASVVLQDLGVRNREMVLAVLAGGDAFRNARKDIEDYGLAISATDAAAIEQANDRIGRLGLISQYAGQQLALALVPAMGALAQAMTDSLREGGLLRAVIDGLANNLDRIGTYIAVAVTGFGVRYVGAMVAARLATLTLSGSLAVLRGALIRTGIGALIVLAGEMVLQFSRLVSAAGGFGNAMSLLGDLAAAVWQGIIDSAGAIPSALDGVWKLMQAGFLSSLAEMAEGFYRFAGRMAGAAGEAGFDGIADRLRGAATEAGLAANDLSVGAEKAAGRAGEAGARAAGIISAAFGPARVALAAMKSAVVGTGDELDSAASSAAGLGDALANAGGGGGERGKGGGAGKGGKALENLKEKADALKESMETVKSGFKSAFDGIVTGSKSVKEALGDILRGFAEMLANRAFETLWSGQNGKGGLGGWLGNMVGGFMGFANGTNSAPGGMALVGERGPELVNLPRGAQVRNAQDTQRILGGGGGGGGVADVRVFVDQDGNWQAKVEQISAGVVRQAAPGISAQGASLAQKSFRNSKSGWSP